MRDDDAIHELTDGLSAPRSEMLREEDMVAEQLTDLCNADLVVSFAEARL